MEPPRGPGQPSRQAGNCWEGLCAFNLGHHHELIRMACKDVERLAHPKLVDM